MSDEQEQPQTSEPISEEAEFEPQDSEEPSYQEVIDDLKRQCAELEDLHKRSLADYQNLVRRTRQEHEQMRQQSTESVINSLLPVLDNCHYALQTLRASDPDQMDRDQLLNSFQMMFDGLLKTLESHGLRFLRPQRGDDFDPDVHQATARSSDPELEPGKIVELLSPGYCLHDKVLKPAQVTVTGEG
jgi:molecular chaperone GrpE